MSGRVTRTGRTGSATGEVRYTAWAPDLAATLPGVSGGSATWTHNLGTTNRITQARAASPASASLGEVWVDLGSNADVIHWSGAYSGDMQVVTVRGVNDRSVSQADYVIGADGRLLEAPIDTLPLAVARADTGGRQGEVYAEREPTGWRIRRTGSADVLCRCAVLSLI